MRHIIAIITKSELIKGASNILQDFNKRDGRILAHAQAAPTSCPNQMIQLRSLQTLWAIQANSVYSLQNIL